MIALPGLGTLVNFIAVIVGSTVGLAVGHRLPSRINEITMQAVGGVVVLIGVQMALEANSGPLVIAMLCSIVVGSILGEFIGIEQRLERLGKRLEDRFDRTNGQGHFTKAFVSTSLLFCVGPMTVLGAIQDGLFGDPTLLWTKSALDGIGAVAFAASLGIGTIFSGATIILYQGALTLLAHAVQDWMTPSVMLLVSATGGVMIMAIGFNIWQVTRLRVGNMLPGIIVAAFVARLLF